MQVIFQRSNCNLYPSSNIVIVTVWKMFLENKSLQSFFITVVFHSIFCAQTKVRKMTSMEALRCELVNQIKLLSIAFWSQRTMGKCRSQSFCEPIWWLNFLHFAIYDKHMWDVKNFKYTFALWPLSVQVRFSLGRRDESATENKVRAFISNYVKSKSFCWKVLRFQFCQ